MLLKGGLCLKLFSINIFRISFSQRLPDLKPDIAAFVKSTEYFLTRKQHLDQMTAGI